MYKHQILNLQFFILMQAKFVYLYIGILTSHKSAKYSENSQFFCFHMYLRNGFVDDEVQNQQNQKRNQTNH